MEPLSTSRREPLPLPWVARLFERMADMYGSLWHDRWASLPMPRVMATWAEDLADLTVDELKSGLSACKTRPFPPTLPEFRALCRPPVNLALSYLEAVEQLVKRQRGEDRWSSPVVFWAAAKIGNDIANHTFDSMKARWTKSMADAEREISEGALPNSVPARMEALPAPGMATVTAEEAQAKAAQIRERMAALAKAKRMPA